VWQADVPDIPGCHTYGSEPTVESARLAVLEAISVNFENCPEIFPEDLEETFMHCTMCKRNYLTPYKLPLCVDCAAPVKVPSDC